MSVSARKAYDVTGREVDIFFRLNNEQKLLATSLEAFPPEHQYLVRIYRNARIAPTQPPPSHSTAVSAAVRFQRSIRTELLNTSLNDRALKQQAFTRVHQLCLAHKISHSELSFNLRGTKAGTANKVRVRLNLVLYRVNVEEFLANTIPHELCHTWKAQLGLHGKPHGEGWKALMRKMGVAPRVCHSMDVSRSRVRASRIHAYACLCKERHILTPRMHRRVQATLKSKPAQCRQCKQAIRYIGLDRALFVNKATVHN